MITQDQFDAAWDEGIKLAEDKRLAKLHVKLKLEVISVINKITPTYVGEHIHQGGVLVGSWRDRESFEYVKGYLFSLGFRYKVRKSLWEDDEGFKDILIIRSVITPKVR